MLTELMLPWEPNFDRLVFSVHLLVLITTGLFRGFLLMFGKIQKS